jgi:ISXO2-like transposase domain
MIISGPGVVVEIDEAKFGKRKYHCGHRVDSVWVLGGVEQTPERMMFAIAVPNGSSETVQDIIRQYVRPGSIIYTD